MKKTMMFCSK